ncbi:phage tail protein [Solirubrobacter ginsenosidimutans]|uniref:Phage tail protein n=1 Tax=Solirubrobacter ginsenosidimutans TaxID=490573 RepID=A0A9X3MUB3_9ACTN|nr:hypothetical protein [Solirubrobacter ginsenosidimutans]MDA0162829.1 phage tail protein [Solirubrobacter ginsenosidimutans]
MEILALEIAPETVVGHGEVTVSWRVAGATSVLLSCGGIVEAEGSCPLDVAETTTVVLTAFDATHGKADCRQATVTVTPEIVPGTIIPWWGDGELIPDGWAVCDGTDGTPDLRDRFIYGADTPHADEHADRHAHALPGERKASSDEDGAHRHAPPQAWGATRFEKDAGGRFTVDLGAKDAAQAAWSEAKAHQHPVVVAPAPGYRSSDETAGPLWHALHYLMKR